ncbi:hypothetical protein U715_07820 [Rhodobacter capsulatus Y262]|nr:hypothetical protein U715_07820 [Rhodobacter capsulatus Y262]
MRFLGSRTRFPFPDPMWSGQALFVLEDFA